VEQAVAQHKLVMVQMEQLTEEMAVKLLSVKQ
jgi:hypothetical protein